jgi:hypothetical protein
VCEDRLTAEAAENESLPPLKSQSWEDHVLDQLIPMITDPEGRAIPYESRDDLRNMLGSNKHRRKTECSTEHQRRPDLLYLVRDADARIVAALLVEVDEHSHTDRRSDCEAAKVDDEFQCLLKLAQEEGKGRLTAARADKVHTPFCVFYKLNPNACDAPGGPIPLAERIRVLAEGCRRLLNTDPTVFHRFSEQGHCMVPHVGCFYYHSKEGGKHLEYFDTHTVGAWRWHGNKCPRE